MRHLALLVVFQAHPERALCAICPLMGFNNNPVRVERTVMKRRVLLAGVSLSTIGVGAAFGSGAFTTVSADRSVELEVKNDANARISFEKGDGATQVIETTDGSGDSASVIKLTQSDLNEQAKTSFIDALTITNNGTGGSAPDVNLYVEDSDLLGGTWDSTTDNEEDTDDTLDFQKNSNSASIVGSENSVSLNAGSDSEDAGDSVAIDIIINLQTGGNKTALEGIETVTFVAEAQSS